MARVPGFPEFVNEDLEPSRLPDDEVASSAADVRITSGVLEQSNVNVAKTLVNMIELSRQYEMQVNVIKTSKEDADAAAQLMRIG